jgi:hypothetical protein
MQRLGRPHEAARLDHGDEGLHFLKLIQDRIIPIFRTEYA